MPIYTVSEANTHQHWTKAKKRHDLQKMWVKLLFRSLEEPVKLPCRIKLVRLGKKKLDSDNLPMSLKWVRDAIADQIIPGLRPGKADDDERITWEYGQEISKDIAVRVEIFCYMSPEGSDPPYCLSW